MIESWIAIAQHISLPIFSIVSFNTCSLYVSVCIKENDRSVILYLSKSSIVRKELKFANDIMGDNIIKAEDGVLSKGNYEKNNKKKKLKGKEGEKK